MPCHLHEFAFNNYKEVPNTNAFTACRVCSIAYAQEKGMTRIRQRRHSRNFKLCL